MDIAGTIPRYEAGDTRMLSLAMTTTLPQTVAFTLFNTDGSTLALAAPQTGETVSQSPTGVYNFIRTLPLSRGFYSYKWTAFDAGSRPYITAGELEIVRTEAYSFFTYSDITDVLRTARTVFGRSDITIYDVAQYCKAADAMIDATLSTLTTVPVVPTPALLSDMSKVYTLWRFYCDQYSAQKDSEPPGIIHRKAEYDDYLVALAAGSASLPGVSLDGISDEIRIIPSASYKPVFDMRDAGEQHVSATLLDDLRLQDESD